MYLMWALYETKVGKQAFFQAFSLYAQDLYNQKNIQAQSDPIKFVKA